MEDIQKSLQIQTKAFGINVGDSQAEQFQAYMELLLQWNEKMNLTAITLPEEIVEKHFLDSLTLLTCCTIKPGAKVIDVGTGAGFPGIPLKIMRPDIQLTLLDGLNKRLTFLEEVCRSLSLESIRVHKRAEEAGMDKTMRESYDIVTARAVAAFPVLCEYCLPLVKREGCFIAMKGPGAREELAAAKRALEILGGGDVQLHTLTLPRAGERNLLVVRKKSDTPKGYPRHGGTISKRPL